MFVKISKTDNKVLRWLSKATDKNEDRPVLRAIHLDDSAAVTSDGHRLHAAKLETVEERGTFEFAKIPAGSTVAEAEPADGQFPRYQQIIDDLPDGGIEVVVNANYLRDAIQGMTGKDAWVRLIAHENHKPLEVYGEVAGQPAYAVVMPIVPWMAGEESFEEDKPKWRPGREG